MNLYASCNLSSMMRPLFWKRMGFSGFSANYQRSLFLCKSINPLTYAELILYVPIVMASRAEANQRVLVRKSLHQLHEYNME